MKKSLLCLALSLVLVLSVTGCGNKAEETEPETETETEVAVDDTVYTFKYAYAGAADEKTSLEQVVGLYLEKELEGRSNGRIQVELYPGGTMGDAEAALEQVELGTLQGCPASDAKLSTRFPAVQVLAMPYLFDSTATANAVLDGEFCAEMYKAIQENTSFTIAGVGVTGFRFLTNSVREIKNPADMKGLKFRVMDSEIMVNMMTNLGAVGVPMAYSELYTAMQTHAIDGQENPATVVWRDFFDEVQGYMTCDGHTYTANFIVINTEWLNSLPEDLQKIVHEVCVEGGNLERETYDAWCENAIKEMVDRTNMQVYYPTEEDLVLFREATQEPAKEWLYENVDAKWVDGILEAVEAVRK